MARGTLVEIRGSFFLIIEHTGKEQRIHVDKSTIIIGKVQSSVQVKAQMTKDGHTLAVIIAEN